MTKRFFTYLAENCKDFQVVFLIEQANDKVQLCVLYIQYL